MRPTKCRLTVRNISTFPGRQNILLYFYRVKIKDDWNLQDWTVTDNQKMGDGQCRTGNWQTGLRQTGMQTMK